MILALITCTLLIALPVGYIIWDMTIGERRIEAERLEAHRQEAERFARHVQNEELFMLHMRHLWEQSAESSNKLRDYLTKKDNQ